MKFNKKTQMIVGILVAAILIIFILSLDQGDVFGSPDANIPSSNQPPFSIETMDCSVLNQSSLTEVLGQTNLKVLSISELDYGGEKTCKVMMQSEMFPQCGKITQYVSLSDIYGMLNSSETKDDLDSSMQVYLNSELEYACESEITTGDCENICFSNDLQLTHGYFPGYYSSYYWYKHRFS